MSRKRKRDETSIPRDADGESGSQLMNSSGNGSIPQANLMASSLDIESAFSESYVAFTAPTLVQQPLIDAVKYLDRCFVFIDWASSNSMRDLATNFLSANPEFLPAIVNLWGISWEQNFQSLFILLADLFRAMLICFAKDRSLHPFAVAIVHKIIDQQMKTVYRVLSDNRVESSIAVLKLLTDIALVPRSPAPDLLYRLLISGFNLYPKLLSRKEATREKEILKLSKRRRRQDDSTLRSCSVDLLLAILRQASTATKETLLGNRVVVGPFVRFLPIDSDITVLAVLETLETHVIRDKKISRAVKSVFFGTEQCLLRIATLYKPGPYSSEATEVANRIRHFLLDVCMQPGNGICFEDRGWYPRPNQSNQETDLSDVYVYNYLFYRLILQLRPFEVSFHRLLTVKILEICPELRAPYLAKLQNLGELGLNFAFISCTALWTEIIQLPLPRNLEDSGSLSGEPPPIETVFGNILPRFVSRLYLSSALNNPSTLMAYYVCRSVHAVLSRLEELEVRYKTGGSQWSQQWDEILERVASNLPELATLVSLRSKASKDRLLSHCVIKSILLYVKMLPHRSASAKLDPRSMLASLDSDWDLSNPLSLIDGMHLLNIIDQQEDLDWWSKQGHTRVMSGSRSGSKKSLIAILLKMRAVSGNFYARRAVDKLVERAMQRSGAFQSLTVISPLSELCQLVSFRKDDSEMVDWIIDFLDESLARFVRQPYGFFDECAKSVALDPERLNKLSPILMTVMHQWRYIAEKEPQSIKFTAISTWLCEYLAHLAIIGEDHAAIEAMLGFLLKGNRVSISPELWVLLQDVQNWSMLMYGTSDLKLESQTVQVNRGERHVDELDTPTIHISKQYVDPFMILQNFRRLISNYSHLDVPKLKKSNLQQLKTQLDHLRSSDKEKYDIANASLAQTCEQFFKYAERTLVDVPGFLREIAPVFHNFAEGNLLVFQSIVDSSCLLLPELATERPDDLARVVPMIVNYMAPGEKFGVALDILHRYSLTATVVEASYIASSVEVLFRSIRSEYWSQISVNAIEHLFSLGYKVQSSMIGEVVLRWLDESTSTADSLFTYVSSFQPIWNSKQVTTFEAPLLNKFASRSLELQNKWKIKLSNCETDLESLRSLIFAQKVLSQTIEDSSDSNCLRTSLKRWETTLHRTLQEGGFAQIDGELLADFLRLVEDIDLEEWLGMVCKYDNENLVPQGMAVIEVIYKRYGEMYHRRLPGWVARTFSRFTRRFAEDKELTRETLQAVTRLELLVLSFARDEEMTKLMETRASYLEPMMLAAIQNHLRIPEVCKLLVSLLSVLQLRSESFHPMPLLQSVLASKSTIRNSTILPSPDVRTNISLIIQKLFEMDILNNSNESVLIGILGMYTGSVGRADRILLDVMKTIDNVRALNILSSNETWNAFKDTWSQFEVEAVGSTLSSPFALIDTEITSRNVINFDVGRETKEGSEQDQKAYERYDPEFWLPIVGYCLDKASHQSDLTLLIDTSAIEYALVCMSSKNEEIRQMSGSVLVRWERSCQVHNLREHSQIKVLMNVLRNSRLEGDNTFVRISKMMSIFLGKALRVMMNSQHILYEKVNIFFLQRPALELDDVPMFYTLSNSGEYFEEEVDWLLGILTAGLDDDAIVQPFKRRHVMEFVFGLYRARTGRYKAGKSRISRKLQEILVKALETGYLMEALKSEYGLAAWLTQEYAFGGALGGDTHDDFRKSVERKTLGIGRQE